MLYSGPPAGWQGLRGRDGNGLRGARADGGLPLAPGQWDPGNTCGGWPILEVTALVNSCEEHGPIERLLYALPSQ